MGRAGTGLIVAVALGLSLAGAAGAAPGDLDTSFGQAGVATIVLPHNAFGRALVVQPDGKIVVAGTAVSASGQTSDVVTARFTQQGAPDTSYGVAGTGVAQPDFGSNETGYAAALQPDGKIVVAGDTDADQGTERPLVTRFTVNGTLDTSFGSGAGWTSPLRGSDFADVFGRAIAVAPNGTIAVGENIGDVPSDFMIEDISPTGTDIAEAVSTALGALGGITVTKDGSVEAVGETAASVTPPAAGGNFQISKVTGFDVSSIAQDLGGTDIATAVATQPDGKLVVAGYTNVSGTDDFAVTRYTGNQVLDTSFGNNGTETVDLGGNDIATSLVIQPDGKIVVAGTTTSGSTIQIGVARLLPNGQPDTGFGHNGVALVGAPAAALEGNAVGLEPDGAIVVGGTIHPNGGTAHNLVIVRLQGDSTPGTGSGTTGSVTTTSGNAGGSTTTPGKLSTPGPPTLSGVTASSKQLHEDNSLPKLNPTGHPRGLLVSLSLNESATLRLQFLASAQGRLAHGQCVVPNKNNTRARHCTRQIDAGIVALSANPGPNTIAFSGRLSPTKKLPPGAYTIEITASAAGKTSAASKITITIAQ